MIKPFDPSLYYHQQVRVYRNLNNRLVSVQANQGGWRLVGHTDNLTLSDVKLVVSECLRVKMVVARRRKVHAYAQGILIPTPPKSPLSFTLHYNPYRSGSFTTRPDNEIVTEAQYLVVRENTFFVVKRETEQLSLF